MKDIDTSRLRRALLKEVQQMKDIDTSRLRRALEHFKFASQPSSSSPTDHCTVGDIQKLINKIDEVLTVFIDELEES